MALTFDTVNKRIILDSASITATELYSRWVDWVSLSDNMKYSPAFKSVGGDDLGGGISIPPYFFLLNEWRVRPMELDHTLVITGNLFVDGGGDPIVKTLGTFNVLVKTVVPVQAQAVSTSGNSSFSLSDIVNAIKADLASDLIKIDELHKLQGLNIDDPLVVSNSERTVGTIVQTLDSTTNQTTVQRIA